MHFDCEAKLDDKTKKRYCSTCEYDIHVLWSIADISRKLNNHHAIALVDNSMQDLIRIWNYLYYQLKILNNEADY